MKTLSNRREDGYYLNVAPCLKIKAGPYRSGVRARKAVEAAGATIIKTPFGTMAVRRPPMPGWEEAA